MEGLLLTVVFTTQLLFVLRDGVQGRFLSWIGMLYCPRPRGNLPSKSMTFPSQHGKTTNNFKWYPQTERSHPFQGILTVTNPFPHFQFSPDGISNNSKTPSNTTQKSPSSNRSRGVSLRTTPWLSTINPQQVLNLQKVQFLKLVYFGKASISCLARVLKKLEHMGVSLNGGTQQPWVFLLKMIILGCFGGTPIFGSTPIYSCLNLSIVSWLHDTPGELGELGAKTLPFFSPIFPTWKYIDDSSRSTQPVPLFFLQPGYVGCFPVFVSPVWGNWKIFWWRFENNFLVRSILQDSY